VANRSRGFPRGSARSRRSTGWEEGPGTNTEHTPSSSSVLILGLGQQSLFDGNTIIRMRGFVEMILESAGAVGDGFSGAFGIGIVTAPAFAVGITAMPTPVTEVEWEGWLWHQWFSLHAVVAAPSAEQRQTFEIDSKAMRKFDSEQVLFAAWEGTESGSVTAQIRLATRILIKLP